MSWFDDLFSGVGDFLGSKEGNIATSLGLSTLLNLSGLNSPNIPQTGYAGGIPTYNAVRRQVPVAQGLASLSSDGSTEQMPARVPIYYDPNRRPGSSGRRYFTDVEYAAPGSTVTGQDASGADIIRSNIDLANARQAAQAQQLGQQNILNPARRVRSPSMGQPMAAGGSVQSKQTGNPSYVMYNDNYYKVAPDGVTVTLYGDPVPENIAREVLSRNYEDTQLNRRLSKDASRASDGVALGLLRLLLGDRRPTEGDLGEMTPAYMTSPNYSAGGIATMAQGRYLNGSSDGMADQVPARIDGMQEARLSDGEFVIPADVVSHFGNGNSDAGAKELYAMMDRVRKARTGTTKQGKQINPSKMLPA